MWGGGGGGIERYQVTCNEYSFSVQIMTQDSIQLCLDIVAMSNHRYVGML